MSFTEQTNAFFNELTAMQDAVRKQQAGGTPTTDPDVNQNQLETNESHATQPAVTPEEPQAVTRQVG